MLKPSLVLAYHGLGRHSSKLDPHNLMVDPELFYRQMLALGRRGYRFVRLTEFAHELRHGTPPPPGRCALTFDDGTLDNLELLKPLLEQLGLPATVFACPALLGGAHFSMPASAGVRLMNVEELRELASSRLIDVGSHTREHCDLSRASPQEAYSEMVASKQVLEDLLQRPIETFAYPGCGYSQACPEAARRAGYLAAVTCGNLGGWGRFELTRESIDSLDRRVGFALKSRRLFFPLRETLPAKVARTLIRPLRHGVAQQGV
jgi:peptidoglycan/xylan/chitin deacetylase (PgdA/CDA1 family)